MINARLFKVLGVINSTQITNWKLVKGVSKWVNAVLIDSGYLSIGDHFAFGFNSKNPRDILNFLSKLLDGKGDPIEFERSEKKLPVLGFKIQITKWITKKKLCNQ